MNHNVILQKGKLHIFIIPHGHRFETDLCWRFTCRAIMPAVNWVMGCAVFGSALMTSNTCPAYASASRNFFLNLWNLIWNWRTYWLLLLSQMWIHDVMLPDFNNITVYWPTNIPLSRIFHINHPKNIQFLSVLSAALRDELIDLEYKIKDLTVCPKLLFTWDFWPRFQIVRQCLNLLFGRYLHWHANLRQPSQQISVHLAPKNSRLNGPIQF